MNGRRLLFVCLIAMLALPSASFAQEEDEFGIDEVEEPKDSRARRRKRRADRQKARQRQREKRRAARQAKNKKPVKKAPVALTNKSTPAAADPDQPGGDDARLTQLREKYAARRWPTSINERPLVLAESLLEVRGDTMFVSLASGFEGDPVSLMPRVYYGVTPSLTLGLVHGDLAAVGARTGAGGLGICIGGDNSCPQSRAYNDIGVDALYDLGEVGGIELAAHGGMVAGSFDPFALAFNLGALARWRKGKLAIVADPRLRIGATARSIDVMPMASVPFNREILSVPVWIKYQLSSDLNLFGHTGLSAMLSGFGDTFVVPLGGGATYAITGDIDIGAELTFWIASGGFDPGEFRYVLLRFAYRTPLG